MGGKIYMERRKAKNGEKSPWGPITKGRTKLFNQALLFVITLNKDDDSNIKSCWVTSDARHPRVFTRKKTDV